MCYDELPQAGHLAPWLAGNLKTGGQALEQPLVCSPLTLASPLASRLG